VPVRLVTGHGNLGSPDDEAANLRYTEARLSRAGALAVSGRPRLPIALINGDLHVGGSRPGFDPGQILDALALAATTPTATDDDLLACIGAPHAATGAVVSGDLAELRAARPARLRYEPNVTAIGTDRLAITNLAPGIGPSEVSRHLAERSGPRCSLELDQDDDDDREELARLVYLPLLDVNDESWGEESRIVLTLRADADIEVVRQQVLDVWPVVVEVDAQLPAPLAELVRAEVDPDMAGQLAAIAALRRLI
jgi:DNA gyrase/topoisomerase IV subunit A